ncbi:MAG: hypothetical protein Q8S16_10895, partial [Polaromonas sp.]|nr:hypothetical protein [Polaromonas sp.]
MRAHRPDITHGADQGQAIRRQADTTRLSKTYHAAGQVDGMTVYATPFCGIGGLWIECHLPGMQADPDAHPLYMAF